MKKSFLKWELTGIVFTLITGVILHFVYEWSGKARFVAPFSAVNESVWEHMKILFVPLFVFSVVQSFFFDDVKGYWIIKLKGTVLGLLVIPVIYYLYTGVIGESADWLNISIFVISVLCAFYCEWKLFSGVRKHSNKSALFLLTLIAIMFIVFTFKTPELNIFKDPITMKYGI